MKLISVHLHYFRKHVDTFVHFPERGIIGLLGANESGKSTILEAIVWALYGAAAARDRSDTIKWKGAHAKQRPLVELLCELDGERIRIERSDKDCRVYAGAADLPVAAGTAVANAYLAQRMGLTLEQFQSSFVCAQKDLARLSAMKPTERQTFVRDVMGISRIDRALEACRRRKNALASERDGLAAGLGEREPLAKDAVDAHQAVSRADLALDGAIEVATLAEIAEGEAHQALADSDERRQQFAAAEKRRVQAEANARSARLEVDRLTAELDDAHDARAELRRREIELQPLGALRTQREQLLAAKATASERETLRRASVDADEAMERNRRYVAECDAAIERHDPAALQQVSAACGTAIRRLDQLIAERQARQAKATAEANAAEQERRRMQRRIEAIEAAGPAGACPTCARALGEQYAAVIRDLRDDLQRVHATEVSARELAASLADPTDEEMAADAEIAELRERVDQLKQWEKDAREAQRRRPEWQQALEHAKQRKAGAQTRLAEIPDTVFMPSTLDQVQVEIARLEKIDAALGALRAKAGRIDLLNDQRAAADQRVQDALGHSAQAQLAMDASGFDDAQHTQLAAAAKAATDAHAEARTAVARAQEQCRAAGQVHARATAALAAYDARATQLEDLTRTVQTHERASDRLDAFRVAAAGTLRPEMEEYVSGFVSVLTDGRHESVTITEDFAVICQEGGVDMEVISGGAEDVVAFAQRVALSQMLAERRGAPLSLLVLDEPFGSLDDVRRPAVLAFLRRLSETFPQLLIISHVDETRTCADHLIEVVHDDARGCSRVLLPPKGTPASVGLLSPGEAA